MCSLFVAALVSKVRAFIRGEEKLHLPAIHLQFKGNAECKLFRVESSIDDVDRYIVAVPGDKASDTKERVFQFIALATTFELDVCLYVFDSFMGWVLIRFVSIVILFPASSELQGL